MLFSAIYTTRSVSSGMLVVYLPKGSLVGCDDRGVAVMVVEDETVDGLFVAGGVRVLVGGDG